MRSRRGYITEQVRRLNSGEINRRRFIMSALGAGVTMPTAMSLASRAEARPRRGGVLRYGAGSEAGFRAALAFARGNGLVEIGADGSLRPELAERFEASEGWARWAFALRRGVAFHDGTPLAATDVVEALARQRDNPLLADVEEVRADGPSTVVVTLRSGNMFFAHRLADASLTIAGTGGFVPEDSAPGRARLRRNPDYWKPGAAWFDAVEIAFMPDAAARHRAAMNGEVDVIDGVDPRMVAMLKRAPGLEVLETPGARVLGFEIRPEAACFRDAALCEALRCAVPRRALVERVLLGHGTALAELPLVEGGEVDLSEVCVSHTTSLPLAASEACYPGAVATARIFAEAARRAGMKIAVGDESAVAPLGAAAWTVRPTADWTLAETSFAWRSKEAEARFRALTARARVEPGEDARTDLYREAQGLIAGKTGALVAMRANDLTAHSTALSHSEAAGGDGGRLAERWWFG